MDVGQLCYQQPFCSYLSSVIVIRKQHQLCLFPVWVMRGGLVILLLSKQLSKLNSQPVLQLVSLTMQTSKNIASSSKTYSEYETFSCSIKFFTNTLTGIYNTVTGAISNATAICVHSKSSLPVSPHIETLLTYKPRNVVIYSLKFYDSQSKLTNCSHYSFLISKNVY